MSYNISKSLYEVPYPYIIKDVISFILASDKDYDSLRAIHFAIDYNTYESENSFQRIIGIINLKNIDLINKKRKFRILNWRRILGKRYCY
jgi:[ribosomal protein S5]-alanine N-acetyltransferase